ncbi:MAG: sugar phosphate isomerase/epimerase, partial [Clostridiales bacterium]|nr:sugar phosphate isomerase/epimerase [Clostridiales bacterium]
NWRRKMGNIGLQLYSIKELTYKDFLGTLEKVAKIGYDGVEFDGYFNTPSGELRNALKAFGLKAAGSHSSIEPLINDLDAMIEYSLQIESPYIICSGLPEEMRNSADVYKRTAELFNKIGRKCKENGLRFGYHNHSDEFEKFDGSFGLDLFVENTDPELFFIELDTYWVEYTGQKSVDFIEKYKERCSILHIKDLISMEDKRNTEIGRGCMDFKAITNVGKKYGVEWYTVEQEYFDKPQLQSIEESLYYLCGILK